MYSYNASQQVYYLVPTTNSDGSNWNSYLYNNDGCDNMNVDQKLFDVPNSPNAANTYTTPLPSREISPAISEHTVSDCSSSTSSENGPHACSMCPKVFAHAYALRGHFVRVHLRQKRYSCNVCDVGFWSNSDLERHMPRHTGQRFICDTCNRTYTSKQRLTEHFRNPSSCWLDPDMLEFIKDVIDKTKY